MPTSSELVAKILALSSDRLTPAIDATSLMSSSSLQTRRELTLPSQGCGRSKLRWSRLRGHDWGWRGQGTPCRKHSTQLPRHVFRQLPRAWCCHLTTEA